MNGQIVYDSRITGDEFTETLRRSLYEHIQITAISLLQQIGRYLGYKAGVRSTINRRASSISTR